MTTENVTLRLPCPMCHVEATWAGSRSDPTATSHAAATIPAGTAYVITGCACPTIGTEKEQR